MNKPLANDALTDNLRKAQTYLSRFKNGPVPHRIAGESVTGAETFENYDPTDNSVLCNVSSGGAAEIDRAARFPARFVIARQLQFGLGEEFARVCKVRCHR
ncbi:MAG: hypothetical protein J0H25_17905 [Rhizobiales bacterium]|nr:hypothetical protein [Hyphomicrobiales bacterium]